MSKESSEQDAGRIQAIRKAAKEAAAPDTMIDFMIVRGITADVAEKAFSEWKANAYYQAPDRSASWGSPPASK